MKFCLKGLKHMYTKDESRLDESFELMISYVRRDETEAITSRPSRGIKTLLRGRGSTFAASRLLPGEASASRHTSLVASNPTAIYSILISVVSWLRVFLQLSSAIYSYLQCSDVCFELVASIPAGIGTLMPVLIWMNFSVPPDSIITLIWCFWEHLCFWVCVDELNVIFV